MCSPEVKLQQFQLRRLFNSNLRCSASGIFVGMNILSFGAIRRKCIWNFMQRLQNSPNGLINVFLCCRHSMCSTILNGVIRDHAYISSDCLLYACQLYFITSCFVKLQYAKFLLQIICLFFQYANCLIANCFFFCLFCFVFLLFFFFVMY